MRVAMYYNNRDIRVEEMDLPRPGPDELLVKIEASSICGSDVMEWYRAGKAPLVLGHEIAGTVFRVGAGVRRFQTGDRVTATHHVPCGCCRLCQTGHETVCETLLAKTSFDPGGFAEFVRLPAINVAKGTWKIPDSVSFDEATFVEPLGCVVRGQRRCSLSPGASVLVIGSGIAGLLHVKLATATGMGHVCVSDISAFRRQRAIDCGAALAFDAADDVAALFRQSNNGRGADAVIVCTSAVAAFTQAMAAVAPGGTILLFAPTGQGVTLPLAVNDLFWRRDVTMTTTYAAGPGDCAVALELLARKRVHVTDLITHRFALADTVKGFGLVAGADTSLKVVIEPQR